MDKRYGTKIDAGRDADIKMWSRIGEGDMEALKALFLRHHIHLYNYALKLSGDKFLAKDCIQDLFYRIWDRRQHLSEVKSVRSYLWVSLRRDVLKAMKGDSREILTDEITAYAPEIHFTPQEFMIQNEIKRECKAALIKALNKLPPRQREAIFLKFFNGMGYDEIEQIMSVSYQSARNYVYEGVQSLKEHFNNNAEHLIPYVFSFLLFILLG